MTWGSRKVFARAWGYVQKHCSHPNGDPVCEWRRSPHPPLLVGAGASEGAWGRLLHRMGDFLQLRLVGHLLIPRLCIWPELRGWVELSVKRDTGFSKPGKDPQEVEEWRQGKDFGKHISFFNICVCVCLCIYIIKFETFEKQSQAFQPKPQSGSSIPTNKFQSLSCVVSPFHRLRPH